MRPAARASRKLWLEKAVDYPWNVYQVISRANTYMDIPGIYMEYPRYICSAGYTWFTPGGYTRHMEKNGICLVYTRYIYIYIYIYPGYFNLSGFQMSTAAGRFNMNGTRTHSPGESHSIQSATRVMNFKNVTIKLVFSRKVHKISRTLCGLFGKNRV